MIYACPPSTPKPSLRSQAGMVDCKHRIWIEKLCVVSKIMNPMEDQKENYAREILSEQQEQGWEGLTTEVAEICQLAGLPNVCKKYISRSDIVKAVELHHLKENKEEMKPLSKLDKIRNTHTRIMQKYMSQKCLQDSRLEFIWETNMIDTRMNMKGRYEKDKYECPHCHEGRQPDGSLETSDHLMVCGAYGDLREGINPELVLEDRATYLRKVKIRRTLLEQQLRKNKIVTE